MRFKCNLKPSVNLIDMTPLVDVIFLLLIFFMVTSDILPLKSLNIENPNLQRTSTPLTTQLLVVMDAQNVIYVGSKKMIVDFASLKSVLEDEIVKLKHQTSRDYPSIVLSVDKRVSYDAFLRLLSLVQECSLRVRLVYHEDQKNA